MVLSNESIHYVIFQSEFSENVFDPKNVRSCSSEWPCCQGLTRSKRSRTQLIDKRLLLNANVSFDYKTKMLLNLSTVINYQRSFRKLTPSFDLNSTHVEAKPCRAVEHRRRLTAQRRARTKDLKPSPRWVKRRASRLNWIGANQTTQIFSAVFISYVRATVNRLAPIAQCKNNPITNKKLIKLVCIRRCQFIKQSPAFWVESNIRFALGIL